MEHCQTTLTFIKDSGRPKAQLACGCEGRPTYAAELPYTPSFLLLYWYTAGGVPVLQTWRLGFLLLHVGLYYNHNNIMPHNPADLETALKKKGGLTLSQLANYDDVITDALVDRVSSFYTMRASQQRMLTLRAGLLLVDDPQAESELPPQPRRAAGRCM